MYKRCESNVVVFLVLYVDDILLIGNNVEILSSVKAWLFKQFEMKDSGEVAYILGIKVIRDHKKGCWLYLKSPTLMKYCLVLTCRTSSRGFYLSIMELPYLKSSVLRHLKR